MPSFGQDQQFIEGQVFVQFDHNIGPSDLLENNRESCPEELLPFIESYDIQKFECPFKYPDERLQRVYLVEMPSLGQEQQLIDAFLGLDMVVFAEKVPLYELSYTPNDLQADQYNLDVTLAESAWDISFGSGDVTVAIVDDACEITHEDLSGSIWTNTSEIPGNGIDDDGNGYIDDVNGFDVAENNNDPNPPIPAWSHGTHCAGIAGATTDNGIGISSIGFGIKIIAVKSTLQAGFVTHAYEGVDYAMAAGADVISMSWGGTFFSATYQLLMEVAHGAGHVLVAAAGNSSTNILHYPAAYDKVIAVGATGPDDTMTFFSNYGVWVDVMAPGLDILSTMAGNGYGDMSGTSMACPFVSGLCGLMLSHNPGLSPDEIEDCLESTCDNIDALNPNFVGQLGAGRVNALQAMQCSDQVLAAFSSNMISVCPGNTVQFTDGSFNGPTSWDWDFPGGSPASSNAQNPTVVYNTPGTYDVSLTVTNPDGSDSVVMTDYITVETPSATITGSAIITEGMSAWLYINFSGNAPWSFDLDGPDGTVAYSNISDSPLVLEITPMTTGSWTLTNLEDQYCDALIDTEANITVLPSPGSIECYFTKLLGGPNLESVGSGFVDPLDNTIYAGGRDIDNGAIAHLETDGTLDWVKKYNGPINSLRSLVRAPNGDLIAACATDDNSYAVMRTDNAGNVIWANVYSMGYDRFPYLVQSEGDSYMITGWTNAGGISDNVPVIRIDANGDVLWSKVFDSVDDQMESIISDGVGGCYIAGGLHIIGGNLNYFLVHVDKDGNALAMREYDASPVRDDNPRIGLTADGGMAITGWIHNGAQLEAFVTKLDANLDHEWSYRIENAQPDSKTFDAEIDNAGNIYFSVRIPNNMGQLESCHLKFEPDGDLIWANKLPTSTYLSLFHNSSNGSDGFLGLSNTTPGSIYGNADAFVTYMDTSFNSCWMEDYDPNLIPVNNWQDMNWGPTFANVIVTTTDITNQIDVTDPPWDFEEQCEEDCPDPCDIQASFTGEPILLCAPSTIDFENQTIDPDSIHWAVNGEVLSDTYDFSYAFDVPGVHVVNMIAYVDSCFDLATLSITVGFLDVNIGEDQWMCMNDSVQLSASGGLDYEWTPQLGLSDPSSPIPMASPDASQWYYVTITGAGGCQYEDSIFVEVDTDCCVTWLDIDAIGELCEGESLTINNQTIATGNATFTWNFGADFNPTSYVGYQPPELEILGLGALSVEVTITDDCGTQSHDIPVNVFPLPTVDAGMDSLLCEPATLVLGGAPVVGFEYEWIPPLGLSDPDQSETDASIADEIEYVLHVTNTANGCHSSDTVHFEVFQPVDLGGDWLTCIGDTIILRPQLVTGDIEWSDGSVGDSLVVTETGSYWVQFQNACGGSQDAVELIFDDCDCEVYVPNAYTPNNDGKNDVFFPEFSCLIGDYEFEIWNRWGEQIFYSTDQEERWVGNAFGGEHYVPNGIYIWKLRFVGLLNPSESADEITGHVSVIR
jgi:gliding motility-associated-like protein